jgi:predicted DNA-binding transcriptional regulator YafY
MASESKRRDRQVVRILGILGALLEGTGASVHDLARRFGTRRETIYRDLRALEDAGYPVVGDDDGHLSRPHLLDGRRTPQVRFTPEELSALDWAAAQATAGPFPEALDGARQKLQVMSAALGQESVRVAEVTDSWGPTAPPTAPEVLLRLAEGILRRRTCTVTYRTPDTRRRKRTATTHIAC